MAAKNLQLLLAAIATYLLISTFKPAGATPNKGQLSSQCERQLQWEKIDHCKNYLRSEMNMLMFPNSGNQACCLRECCEMLQEMDENCVCEAVKSMAEEETEIMMKRGEGRQMGRVVLKKAMHLPQRCGISAQCEAFSRNYY